MSYLRQVVTAATYEERHCLLDPHVFPGRNNLAKGLYAANHFEHDRLSLQACPDSRIRALSRSALYTADNTRDRNPGPAEVWFNTHQDASSYRFIFSSYHRKLRNAGYVLWDQARLQRLDGFQDSSWMGTSDIDGRYSDVDIRAMERSFAERRGI